jgi:hypothetical protein
MPTKQALIGQYEIVIEVYEGYLTSGNLPEDAVKAVTATLKRAKDWIAFLKLPDTPELGW